MFKFIIYIKLKYSVLFIDKIINNFNLIKALNNNNYGC